jgi:polyribonucleotide nucleotidyltransferase
MLDAGVPVRPVAGVALGLIEGKKDHPRLSRSSSLQL